MKKWRKPRDWGVSQRFISSPVRSEAQPEASRGGRVIEWGLQRGSESNTTLTVWYIRRTKRYARDGMGLRRSISDISFRCAALSIRSQLGDCCSVGGGISIWFWRFSLSLLRIMRASLTRHSTVTWCVSVDVGQEQMLECSWKYNIDDKPKTRALMFLIYPKTLSLLKCYYITTKRFGSHVACALQALSCPLPLCLQKALLQPRYRATKTIQALSGQLF